MTHHLRKHADVAAELVRIVRDDLAAALADLDAPGRREERVHSVRQRLKWVRSILRVLKGAPGEEAADLRQRVADVAGLLAAVRDAEVAAASARALSSGGDRGGFGHLAADLDRQAAVARRRRLPVRDACGRLLAVAEEASRFPTDFDGAQVLNAGIAHAYRRGQRTMAAACATRAVADLHAWRKQAKYLWHLLRLVRRLAPRHGRHVLARLDQLTELLGLDHDHAMLAEKLALAPGDPSLGQRLALIAEHRRGMEDAAFVLGKAIYFRQPRDFARRHKIKTGKP